MTDQTKDGGPAFPVPLNPGEAYKEHGPADGLTVRDYFAARALESVMLIGWRDLDYVPVDGHSLIENNAALAYQVADAMLAARNQTNTKD